jgi:chromate reductase
MLNKISFVILSFFLLIPHTYAADKGLPLLVISTSMDPNSKSAKIAKGAFETLKAQGQDVDFLDLREFKLPFVEGHGQSAYDDPQVKVVHDRILKAQGIIIAAPIYNNSVGASATNLFNLTNHAHGTVLSGKAWNGKVVAFIGSSGGKGSTYSFVPFLNSLMLNSKVVVLPNFVMVTGEDFNDKSQFSEGIQKRIDELTSNLVRFTNALALPK